MNRLITGITLVLLLIVSIKAQTGSILREYWTGVSGTSVSSLTSDSRFPSSPSESAYLTKFEAQTNWNDNYGTRIRGFVHPPVTGNYIFWVCGDDNSELWLSTDDKQSNKVLIARNPGYTNELQWDKYPEQQSAAIPLVAGRRYYIEGLHKEGAQGDNFAVGWQIPGSSYERPIPGNRLSPVIDDDDYSLWSDSAKIIMNTTATGANISGNVTKVPILIRLNESNFNFSEASANGDDIRFSKPDGTHLFFQIDRWDTLSKEADIFVKLDTVYGNNSTQFITMFWGKDGAVARSNGSLVYDTANGFRGVWHLKHNPAGTAPQMYDATRLNYGTSHGSMTSSDVITGIVGKGIDLDGVDDYISTGLQYNNPTVFTISIWFKTITNNGGKLISFGNLQTGQSANYDRNLWIDNEGHIQFGIYSSGDERVIGTTNTYNDGEWHQVTGQLSSAGLKLYVDGTLMASNPSYTTPESFNGYWRIGYDNLTGWPNVPNSFFIQAAIDEAVISHTARSDNWIKLDYENQRNNSNFITIENSAGKPVINFTQMVAAVSESSLTYQAFYIGASIGAPKTIAKNLLIKLGYYGSALNGIDYSPLSSTYPLTIPADSTHTSYLVNLIPIEDLLEEGNETLYVVIQPDTSYRLGGNDTIAIVITDNDQKFPPVIIAQPSNISVLTGDVATFTVNVTGSTPLMYKWRKNGIVVSSGSSTFYTSPVSMSDSGARFDCIVSNSAGSDTSDEAILSVTIRPEAPYIIKHPTSITLTIGDTALFEIVMGGTPPFQYQWYRNTAAIPGENKPVLKVGPLTLNNSGEQYYCHVSNLDSERESNKALLTVKRPSSHTLIITGDLLTSKNIKVGLLEEAKMDFVIKLYQSATSDSVIYTETFLDSNNQAIKVKDGKFAIQLGAGETKDDLMSVVRENANIFVTFTISPPGCSPETLNRRVPLTASPYALSSLPPILKGIVHPDTAEIEAPIGTHFVRTSTNATYIKTHNGWAELTE